MKLEEKIAEVFLIARYGERPRYEPLGKGRPPDFSISSSAFEVRRLNQHFNRGDGTTEPLDRVSYPLERAVKGELGKIEYSSGLGSFYSILDYRRPLAGKPNKIARQLAAESLAFYREG